MRKIKEFFDKHNLDNIEIIKHNDDFVLKSGDLYYGTGFHTRDINRATDFYSTYDFSEILIKTDEFNVEPIYAARLHNCLLKFNEYGKIFKNPLYKALKGLK